MTTITATGKQMTGEDIGKKKREKSNLLIHMYILYILLSTVTNLINLFSVYLLFQLSTFHIFACASH